MIGKRRIGWHVEESNCEKKLNYNAQIYLQRLRKTMKNLSYGCPVSRPKNLKKQIQTAILKLNFLSKVLKRIFLPKRQKITRKRKTKKNFILC